MRKKLIVILALVAFVILATGGLIFYLIKAGKINPKAAGTGAILSLNPATSTTTLSDTFNAEIIVNTGGAAVDDVDIFYLHFDPAVLQVQDSDPSQAGVQIAKGTIFGTYTGMNVDNTNGTISVSGLDIGGLGYNGTGVFATVTFKSISVATTNVTFDFTSGSGTDSNIVEHGTALDILTSVSSGVYTISNSTPSSPTVNLKIDGQNGPITKNQGESATLSWTSSNADSCNSSWGGAKSTSGSESTGLLTATKTFILDCSGGGKTARDSAVVNVSVTGAPTVDIKANDTDGAVSINQGESANLSWSSTGADSCKAGGDWSGDKQVSGSESTGAVDVGKTYILTCSKNGIETADSVTIEITANSDQTITDQTANTPEPSKSQNTTAKTETPINDSTQVSKLPTNIQPQPTPAKKDTISLIKNQSMKPWVLWFLYAIIPAFLAGIAIYLYIKRRKTKQDEVI